LTNLYAVHGRENIFTVVKANSKKEAFDVFASNQIKDENLNDFITNFAINEGLFEQFYKDDQGSFLDNYMNGGPERLQQLNEQERETYIDSWIEKNINQFWNDEPQFATEYLEEFNKGIQSNDFYKPEFSHDFWVNTIKKVIQQRDWYEDFDIIKIDLADHDYQLIYR